jgi:hypothetical protein
MRVKTLAHKNKMGKNKTTNTSTSWVPSEFKQTDLTKAQKEGLIAEGDQVVFPSTERIPKPPSGYRVMFLAFLLHDLSFPAHEFLRGLLFVYGVQLHQLTPNSILHIACFITLCESFLGVEPHWILWKYLFRLRPSVALSKKAELGGAVVSIHAEAHYLEFAMAASVQGWRKKWFYIKDQKISSSDQYGIAPFDADKDLKKLASWDSPPTEAEMEDSKPLLARIQALKSGSGGALSGTQLMSFFLQRRVQPLQHRISKLWSYSGLEDSSRVSEDDMDKKDLDKRVRALTTLTKDHEIPALAADFFDFERPLPVVYAFSCTTVSFIRLLLSYHCFSYNFSTYFSFRITSPLFLVLLFQREDLFRLFLSLLRPKPPRLRTAKTEMKPKIRWKEPVQLRRLLLRFLKILVSIRRGNVSRSSFLRVPLLTRVWPGRPLL